MPLETLYETLHETCLPGLWSRGVSLARAGSVIAEFAAESEIVARVHVKDRPTSPKVNLWFDEDDWFCDCGFSGEACAHAAAAVIAAKNGWLKSRESETQTHADVGAAGAEADASPAASSTAPYFRYELERHDHALMVKRLLVEGGKREPFMESLIGLVGAVGSGRVERRAIAASKEDFSADQILAFQKPKKPLEPELMRRLLTVFRDVHELYYEGRRVRATNASVGFEAELVDERDGFRLRRLELGGPNPVVFSNGAALLEDLVRPFQQALLSSAELELLSGAGTFVPRSGAARLVIETLPALQKKITVHVRAQSLPKRRVLPPRAVLRLEKLGSELLMVTPELVYGDPPIARVAGTGLELLNASEIPERDLVAEHALERKLQNELQLKAGQVTRFEGLNAVRFASDIEGWDVVGSGCQEFSASRTLVPRLEISEQGFELFFELDAADGRATRADPNQVLAAWHGASEIVPLLGGGGFARLPLDWLQRFGEKVSALLAARAGGTRLPPAFLPQLAALAAETESSLPLGLRKLQSVLEEQNGIPQAPLSPGLRAELRHYQRTGVDWLCFLREAGLGALLADDMGLGKTLQTLCALRGRTLIVAPTSVLYGWAGQLDQFWPDLTYSVYHGAGRALDQEAQLVLTTYAILRLDSERLTAAHWDTVVLDEAQTIKNPVSQVAAAAHALRGDFRIALSGTPVENRVEDLWSQFQFLNPGLLGTRTEFQERFAAPIARGDAEASRCLRRLVRPFLLRRLKADVAPELPERTETVLHCELNADERAVYQAVLAATKSEVVAELKQGGSVLKALEALLRLRQACSHTGLLPGQSAATSSKFELLLESLRDSLAAGHRALVFSQWTSLLDLLEPRLAASEIGFLRIDGATKNRQQIVDRFQAACHEPVLLISLKAGGVGLTLTAADHIFLLDPWWNPAVEDQAADRAHRIGQLNPVLIHRLVARETVEERILLLQKRKLEVAAAVLGGAPSAAEAGGHALTRDDLLDLLA